MTRVFIALGANLGDPVAQLREASRRLAGHPAVSDPRLSPLYLSDPVGVTDQPRFANAVMELQTHLPPLALLEACQAIEQAMGRVRTRRWGPRTIDLDILFYGELKLQDSRLELPHPRWRDRAFVVRPLHDLAPDLVIAGVSVHEVLGRLDCSDLQPVG